MELTQNGVIDYDETRDDLWLILFFDIYRIRISKEM
jgi:hypothetical protein